MQVFRFFTIIKLLAIYFWISEGYYWPLINKVGLTRKIDFFNNYKEVYSLSKSACTKEWKKSHATPSLIKCCFTQLFKTFCIYQQLNITCGVLLNVIALFVHVHCTNNCWNLGFEGQCPIIWRKRVWDTGCSGFLLRMRDSLKFRNNKMTHGFSCQRPRFTQYLVYKSSSS